MYLYIYTCMCCISCASFFVRCPLSVRPPSAIHPPSVRRPPTVCFVTLRIVSFFWSIAVAYAICKSNELLAATGL